MARKSIVMNFRFKEADVKLLAEKAAVMGMNESVKIKMQKRLRKW